MSTSHLHHGGLLFADAVEASADKNTSVFVVFEKHAGSLYFTARNYLFFGCSSSSSLSSSFSLRFVFIFVLPLSSSFLIRYFCFFACFRGAFHFILVLNRVCVEARCALSVRYHVFEGRCLCLGIVDGGLQDRVAFVFLDHGLLRKDVGQLAFAIY